jgi:Plant ATP synthase F0
MPQFDISSFVVQLLWLFISLIGFYVLLCLYFLPVTSQYIKSRKSSKIVEKNCSYPLLNLCSPNFIKTSLHKKVIF